MICALLAAGISLSPAVIQLRGEPGQSTTQLLTVLNTTSAPMTFELEAKDVAVRDGKRAFVNAGELPASIAATAVFSAKTVTVPPGESRQVAVTLTLAAGGGPRGVVALFRTRIASEGKTSAFASLGTLFTFTLSDKASLSASELAIVPQSASSNAAFLEHFVNDGAEPVVPRGMAVILDSRGAMVAKAPFEPHRLLPGEQTTLRTEYPGELQKGSYRVLATFDYEGHSLTRSAALVIP